MRKGLPTRPAGPSKNATVNPAQRALMDTFIQSNAANRLASEQM
jgi:hypothetical protein